MISDNVISILATCVAVAQIYDGIKKGRWGVPVFVIVLTIAIAIVSYVANNSKNQEAVSLRKINKDNSGKLDRLIISHHNDSVKFNIKIIKDSIFEKELFYTFNIYRDSIKNKPVLINNQYNSNIKTVNGNVTIGGH